MYKDATIGEVENACNEAWNAFQEYKHSTLKTRADFMRTIAREIEDLGEDLIKVACQETNLPEARMRNERARTIFQLTSYAEACERGLWMDIRIDTAIPDRNPPKPDLRKMLVPLGPVAVFGAANFPFAYSTAGGDTACALAAGCPVIVKAHPAHASTSQMVADAIQMAARKMKFPLGVFTHIHGKGFEVGKTVVTHQHVKAVGFTGSFLGGKQLFDWANQRKEPIPVFAEMSSINPVFILPEKLNNEVAEISKMYSASIMLGVGQFCTNPGLIIGIQGDQLDSFMQQLANDIRQSTPGTMLHEGIAKNYLEKRSEALKQEDVETIAIADKQPEKNQGVATLASASAKAFLNNPILHQEVFGPYSLVVKCMDMNEMIQVAEKLEGQLTATLIATENEIVANPLLVDKVRELCGRFILNSVPTGVEVCLSMQHGGPFPSTTDSRFTSVGADGIKRFARPLCFQNWANHLLPDELKNENPLKLFRVVNDVPEEVVKARKKGL